MQHHSVKTLSLLAVLLAILAGFAAAQDFKDVHPGVEYVKLSRVIDGRNVNFDLLRLDLKKIRLDVVHAMDSAIGTEKTSSLARRHNAVAAINAGFFRLDNSIFAGEDTGILLIDKQLFSDPIVGREALVISNTAKRTDVRLTPIRGFAGDLQWNGRYLEGFVRGVNRERVENDSVIYFPSFGRTTLTDPGGVEIVVSRGRVRAIRDSSSPIPPDGFVLSFNGERKKNAPKFKVGDNIRERIDFTSPGITPADRTIEDVVGGAPRLIRGGKIDITWKEEKASKDFVETRHPRTAVAILTDGKVLLLTADGRSDASTGIDLYDLADFLLALGAVDALNLDGGGSTTMVLDGKIVNQPSDKGGERKIGDALIVTLRK
ncbi:MAG TPA: phosphodiester glycosidase family protein [Pyrinomonadaceae bacterium]|nr:phosphodiester glycosidase family protein [Pyrinomonadaceae bacterium]